MSNSTIKFEIWIEIDEYHENNTFYLEDEFCNAIVSFPNGEKICLNIWSEKFLKENIYNIDWIDNQIAILPDLVIKKFTASSIREVITILIQDHNWFVGRGFPVKDNELNDSPYL